MNKNKKIGFVVGGVVVLIVVFYVGMFFGKGQVSNKNIPDLQAFGQNGAFPKGARMGNPGVGFTTGQVVAKDSQSITVSTINGSSKIILINNNTPVSKQASGAMTDIVVGTEISITGTTNQDGSVSAQSVQIRPKMQAAAPTPVGQ